MIPYNQTVRQNNFFNRVTESPLAAAGNQIVKGPTISSTNLPAVAKQNGYGGSANETKDTINGQETSRRGSGGFSVKRPKMVDPDFDFSSLNLNLR